MLYKGVDRIDSRKDKKKKFGEIQIVNVSNEFWDDEDR